MEHSWVDGSVNCGRETGTNLIKGCDMVYCERFTNVYRQCFIHIICNSLMYNKAYLILKIHVTGKKYINLFVQMNK